MIQWSLTAHGKLFHSGLPHKGINSIELANEAVAHIQSKFYQDFPAHPMEKEYNYSTSSTMKPTQIECAKGSLNQLPPHCTVSGDIRLTPFYDVKDVRQALEGYVSEINDHPDMLLTGKRGAFSRFELPDMQGRLELRWVTEGENGIACTLGTEGNVALVEATREVIGQVKPYSITGSLPLVRDLQDWGFDVQISGYGLSSRYHADNECADINHLKNCTKILARIIGKIESGAGPIAVPAAAAATESA